MAEHDSSGERATIDLPDDPPKRTGRRRAWLWFAAGFLPVFVWLLFRETWFYSGRYVMRVPLWDYYLRELDSAMRSAGVLGPKYGSASAALGVAALHVFVSFCAGLATRFIGSILHRRRDE